MLGTINDVGGTREGKTIQVKKDKWTTVEWSWNVKMSGWFKEPAGAEIKVVTGAGFFSRDSQKQKLDGTKIKKLDIGIGSLFFCRMQIKTNRDMNVGYVFCTGNVIIPPTSIPPSSPM